MSWREGIAAFESLPKSMAESTSLTRKSLYKQVWSEAMCRLAKRYGLSDVGLAKICRKHNIPRPPRGYWAKKQFGKAPPQTPLPNPANDSSIELRERTGEESRLSPCAKEIRKMKAAEDQKELHVEVAETLRGSHPLVSEANQQLQSAKPDEHGLISHFEGLVLNICVSTRGPGSREAERLVMNRRKRFDAVVPTVLIW